MAKEVICIDLGTSMTRVYLKSSGTIFNEPTCISLSETTKEVLEIGYLANYSSARSPMNVRTFNPIINGVVSDIDLTYMFLKQIFINQHLEKKLKKSIIYVSCPNIMTKVERNALIATISKLGAKRINLVSTSRASAFGSGVDFSSPRGIMTLDIGAGKTDCGILVSGQNAFVESLKVASFTFDSAINKYLRKYKNIMVGNVTIQTIKMRIGNISKNTENQFFEVTGKDIVTGLPLTVIISSNELRPVLIPYAQQIVDLVVDSIKYIKPELASDISKTGILVTGSGALLGGMKEYLNENLNIPIHYASDMSNGVLLGLQKFASEE